MTKNNKKSPATIARQAAFRAEFGGDYKTITARTPEFSALCAELIGDDTTAAANRRADEGLNGFRENSPELYGRRQIIDVGAGYSIAASVGAACDCELSETESALVKTTAHTSGGANTEGEGAVELAEIAN